MYNVLHQVKVLLFYRCHKTTKIIYLAFNSSLTLQGIFTIPAYPPIFKLCLQQTVFFLCGRLKKSHIERLLMYYVKVFKKKIPHQKTDEQVHISSL